MMDTSWTKNYSNAAYVDLGVGCRDSCVAFTRECAGYFGWTCDVLEGDPRLLVMLLSGDWSEEDFLVVPPGAVIVVTHDGRLVDAAR
jgi:hypothetical protein